MAHITYEIIDYTVRMGFDLDGSYMGGSRHSQAYIECSGADGQQMIIMFAAPYATTRLPSCNEDGSFASINRHIDQMPYFLDILRNEERVYANLRSDFPNANHIATTTEPTGERVGPRESNVERIPEELRKEFM
ncbi:MAG: hypothetical protein OCC49_15895 [Fibrobacterales bacterium]